LQPMPSDFDLVKGDLNLFKLPKDAKDLIDAAKSRNMSTVVINKESYAMDLFMLDTEVRIVFNVYARRSQVMSNGLVIKLVRYEEKEISYVV
jgi:hypothetical protein